MLKSNLNIKGKMKQCVTKNIILPNFNKSDSFGLPYTNNLLLWLTGRISSFTLDGINITNWADGSGLGNDLAQPTVSLQPEISTLAGFDVVNNANSPGTLLSRSDSLGLTGSPNLTLMFVIKSNLGLSQNTVFKIGGNNAGSLAINKRSASGSHQLSTAFQNGSVNWSYNFTTDLILLTASERFETLLI